MISGIISLASSVGKTLETGVLTYCESFCLSTVPNSSNQMEEEI